MTTVSLYFDTTITIPTTKKDGGVRLDSGFNLHLFGKLEVLYRMSEPQKVDRYSYMNMNIDVLTTAKKTKICFYENEEEAEQRVPIINYESRCTEISFTNPSQRIDIGEAFNYRNATIRYISIAQEDSFSGTEISALTVLSNFTLIHEDTTSYYETYDTDCSLFDENSMALLNEMSNRCSCNHGYVSSNTGKVLGVRDVCIKNIGEGYDGNACGFFRDCKSGYCVNGSCQSSGELGVSVHNYFDEQKNEKIRTLAVPIESSAMKEGGIIVDADNSLKLYGETEVLIQLSETIPVSKYSIINLIVGRFGNHLLNKVCLLNSKEMDIDEITIDGYYKVSKNCPFVCLDVTFSSGVENIRIEDLVKHTDIYEIDYIFFHQAKAGNMESGAIEDDYTMIQSIEIKQLEPEPLFDENDECRDPNSYRSRRIESCLCFDGFISTSGGKTQDVYGTCVQCLDQSENHCFSFLHSDLCARVSTVACK